MSNRFSNTQSYLPSPKLFSNTDLLLCDEEVQSTSPPTRVWVRSVTAWTRGMLQTQNSAS